MTGLRFYLFGYPRLLIDDLPVAVERRKSLALAVYLALEAGACGGAGEDMQASARGCSRESLSAMFWPEGSQQQAGAYLRQALWDLTRSLGEDSVVRERQSVYFNPQLEIWADVNDFVSALESWKAGTIRPPAAIHHLAKAVSLYQDDFLTGFSLRDSPSFDDWQTAHTELLRIYMAQMLEILVKLHTRQQEWDAALDYARRWSELDKLDESAHRALMQLYAQTDQRSAALRQFQLCQEILSTELGVPPASETAALYAQIKESPWDVSQFPTTRPASPPTGTVTFLFTDIEGSTRLWEAHPIAMQQAFSRQEALIRQAMLAHGGYVYKMIGDAFQVAFPTASDALAAAVDAQRGLHAEPWGAVGAVKVRMALHTGVTEERGDDYVGPELNRAARIMSAGYGGQVLLSQPTYELIRSHLPVGISLRDLGEHRLKDLESVEHLYQVSAQGLPVDFPPLKTLDSLSFTLPVMPTAFVGRAQELTQIEAMLAKPDCRLLTLLGIGGSGKTRLAIQAASQTQSYQRNACFVPLASCSNQDEMILAIAQAIQFKLYESGGFALPDRTFQDALIQYLADKRLLLVLDNFEQLIDCAELIDRLLQAAPRLKLIVTSRERLNLPGEWVLEVMGLAFPAGHQAEQALDYPAVQLFIACTQRISSARLTPEDYPAIIRICQLMEGVPLGIEMAAAWVKVLTCAEVAAEIEKDLDFLAATWRGMPERHRTLRAVFDHSWKFLSDREQDGFTRLAVFEGGFTRQAAAEVAGASILLLAALTDKSFLRRTAAGRYEIHPVLNGYLREKLTADPALYQSVKSLHAHYFGQWLFEMTEALIGRQQMTALAGLRGEMHNLRLALQWIVRQEEFDLLEKVLPRLVLFSTMNDQRVYTNAVIGVIEELCDVLSARGDRPGLLALALAILRFTAVYPTYSAKNEVYGKQSMDLLSNLPDSPLKAFGLLLNSIGITSQPFNQSLALAQASMKIFIDLGETWPVTLTQLVMGDIHNFGGGDPVQAREYYQVSRQDFTEQGNLWGVSLCLYGLLELAARQGNLEEAYHYGCQARELLKQLENSERILQVNHRLGELAIQLGKIPEARQYFSDNLAAYTRLGFKEPQRYYQERLTQLSRSEPASG